MLITREDALCASAVCGQAHGAVRGAHVLGGGGGHQPSGARVCVTTRFILKPNLKTFNWQLHLLLHRCRYANHHFFAKPAVAIA